MESKPTLERKIAQMVKIFYNLGEPCPICHQPMHESPPVLDLIVVSCVECGYTERRWQH